MLLLFVDISPAFLRVVLAINFRKEHVVNLVMRQVVWAISPRFSFLFYLFYSLLWLMLFVNPIVSFVLYTFFLA